MKQIAAFILLSLFFYTSFSQEPSKLDNEKVLDFIQTQRYKEAAEYIKSVYPGVINDDKIISRLGYIYYMNGNLPEAETSYLILLKKDTLNKSTLFSLAAINTRRGNYALSTDYYNKIISIDSTIFSVYKQLADIGLITKDTNTVFYLEKANTLNPQDGDVAYDLSDLYVKGKKYKEADSILSIAINADTTNLMLYRAKAKLVYARKQYKDLLTICEKLLREGDKSPIVLRWLGEGYFYTKEYQKSLDKLFQMHELELPSEASLFMIAENYKNLNEPGKAVPYYLEAVSLGTKVSESVYYYYYALGDSYRILKQSKNAVAAYQKSLQYKEFPFAYYQAASLYDKELKDKTNAVKYYKKFIANSSEKGSTKEYYVYSKARVEELLR